LIVSRRFGGKRAEKALEGFNGFHPIGKIGSAEEVANAVVFYYRINQAGPPALS
jgi:hypothetical protein